MPVANLNTRLYWCAAKRRASAESELRQANSLAVVYCVVAIASTDCRDHETIAARRCHVCERLAPRNCRGKSAATCLNHASMRRLVWSLMSGKIKRLLCCNGKHLLLLLCSIAVYQGLLPVLQRIETAFLQCPTMIKVNK